LICSCIAHRLLKCRPQPHVVSRQTENTEGWRDEPVEQNTIDAITLTS